MRQVETNHIDALTLHFYNIYETMELSTRNNIIRSKQLTKNQNQASTKDKQSKNDHMKAIFSIQF